MSEPEHARSDGTVRKDHYGAGRQPWDDIVDVGWGPGFAAGNALKYVRRANAKNGDDDLRKGRWYFNELRRMALGIGPYRDWTYGKNDRVDAARAALKTLLNILTPAEAMVLSAIDDEDKR